MSEKYSFQDKETEQEQKPYPSYGAYMAQRAGASKADAPTTVSPSAKSYPSYGEYIASRQQAPSGNSLSSGQPGKSNVSTGAYPTFAAYAETHKTQSPSIAPKAVTPKLTVETGKSGAQKEPAVQTPETGRTNAASKGSGVGVVSELRKNSRGMSDAGIKPQISPTYRMEGDTRTIIAPPPKPTTPVEAEPSAQETVQTPGKRGEYMSQVLSAQKRYYDEAEAQYSSASKNMEASESALEEIIATYGGERKSDGSLAFPTQEGLDAYNVELQKRKKASDALTAAEETMRGMSSAYTDSVQNYNNYIERYSEYGKTYDAQNFSFADLGNEIASLDKEIETVKGSIAFYERNVSNAQQDRAAGKGNAETLKAIENRSETLLEEKNRELARLEQERLEKTEEYAYYYARIFYDMENDPKRAQKIAEGKALYDAEYDAYEKELSADRSYLVTIGLNDDPSAANDIRQVHRSAHPTALMLDFMTDQEREGYFYLLAAGQERLAIQYANELAQEDRRNAIRQIEEWAGTNTGTRLLATGAHLVLLPFAGPYDMQMAQNRAALTGLEAGNVGIGFGGVRSALSSGVAEGLTEKGLFNTGFLSGTLPENIPVVGGTGLGSVYQLGLSTAESFISANVYGTSSAFLLGFSAGSSAFEDALNKGASYDQAVLQGTAQGVAETLFEYVSIDQLLKNDISRGAIKQLLIQGGVEASEEAATSVANLITDALIMGDKSDFNLTKQSYIDQSGRRG